MSAACRLPATVILVLSLWVAMSSPTSAQEPEIEPTPVTTPEPIELPSVEDDELFGPLPSPTRWAADVFNQVLVSLLQSISEGLHRVVDGVLQSPLNFITQTPPAGSYDSPTVQTLWGAVRVIANAGLALVALWGGFNLILREHLSAPYHEAMELVPRLILGALLVNTSHAWAQLAIDLNNALCTVVGQVTLPAWEQADLASQLVVDVLAVLIYLVMGLLLVLQMLMRLALVNVLLVAAPLGLLCWVLPQTHGWARLWSTTFFGTVFVQFVQVLALRLGGALLTELTPMAPASALLAVLLGIAVLTLTLKIPGLMRSQVGDGLGFARYLVYRQVARVVEASSGGAARRTGGA